MAKLVVIIPSYNEEKTIGKVIREIPRKISGLNKVEILVIDDGSKDSTVKVAKGAGADNIISHSTNKGVGVAFSTGIENALKMDADVIVNIDADGQFNPDDIAKLVTPILKKEADMVTGTRFADRKLEPKMPLVKKFGNKIFTRIISNLSDQQFTDTQCGFRAYSREAALSMNLFGSFTYTQEVFLDLVNKGLPIREVPIKVKYIKGRKSKVVRNPFSYGFRALSIIIRTIRDSKPLKFFGGIGAIVFLAGGIPGLALFIRWLLTATVTPYKSLINLSSTLMILGLLLIFLALIADMQGRERKILEEILYYNKVKAYGSKKK